LLAEIDEVPENIRQGVINNGGGHANHSFFWKIMLPAQRAYSPEGALMDALNKQFGSFESFKQEFSAKAMSVFGSGWAFLIKDNKGKLLLKRHSFQNSPLMHGNTPILGIDLWEHAYYLKYQNRKAEYVDAFWHIINWKQVEKNYNEIMKHE
jgi:Fe-Mn family superoxide dismutase